MGKKERKHSGLNRFWKILLIVIVVLVAIRIALPYVLLEQANKRLKSMPGYYGHIDDITISLYRGAYGVHDYYLDKQDTITQVRTPFVAGEAVDLSLEWRAIFKGKIVGEIVLERPIVRFTKDRAEPDDVVKDTTELAELLDDFMPIKINRMEIHNGSFEFTDPTTSPQVHLAMENIALLAENLSTVNKENELLPAYVTMDADVYAGRFTLDMELDPIANSPTFDMATEVTGTDLTLFNEFFLAYGNFDVKKGTFGMYTEVASNEGKFLGYVKPVITDLEILGPEDKEKSLGNQIWQGLVGLGSMLLTNPKEDQIATRVPLEGDLDDPNVLTWYAVIDLLRNAFISALEPQIDNEINIQEVPQGWNQDDRSFFQRLFKGQGPDQKERDEKRKQRRKKKDEGKSN